MKKTKNKKPSYSKIILVLIIVSVTVSFFIFRDKTDMSIKKNEFSKSKTIMGNDIKGISPQKSDENKRFQPGDPNAVFPEKLTW